MAASAPPAPGVDLAPGPAHAWATACEYAACTLDTEPGSARLARDFVRSTLRAWGFEDRLADVELVAHEFVVNALTHGLGHVWAEPCPHPVVLGLFRDGDDMLCAAFDPGIRQPRPVWHRTEPSPLADAGRGLQLVAAVSEYWGWTPPGPEGKAVWAAFCSAPAVPPALANRLLSLTELLTGRERPRLITATARPAAA
ncbi:ATP-binding protein [Streptomyces sp. NPDC051940]|uniref:ATP-binding protein n=1 Tax=Streptomyces sp. NPDC051940 TaxID=3155675 RepID=UPI003436C7A0